MIDLDKIRQRWRGAYTVDGLGKVGPSELPPDIAALCDEVERLERVVELARNIRTEFRNNDDLYPHDRIRRLGRWMPALTDALSTLAAPPSPGGE